MSTPKSDREWELTPRRKAHIYLCLVPVFGFVPAVLALVRDRGGRELRDAAKVSVVLALAWAVSYMALGGGQEAEVSNVSLELLKGSLTSAYFTTTIWLMFRLYRGKPPVLPWQSRSRRSPESRLD